MKKMLHLILLLSGFCGMAQNYSLDTSFGNNGQAIGNGLEAIDLFYINDKYITVHSSQISRFNHNGSLDETFGSNGAIIFNSASNTYQIKSAKLLDGFIFVCGYVYVNDTSHQESFVAKISINGIPDATFGTNGIATFLLVDDNDSSSNNEFSDILPQTDGSLLIIGTIATNPLVVKINPSGLLDYNFNTHGYKVYSSSDTALRCGKQILNYDDGILLINSSNYNDYEFNIELIKINADGNYSQNFGINGIRDINIGVSPLDFRVLLSNDNLIISYSIYNGRPGNSSIGGTVRCINLTDFSNVFNYTNLNRLPYIKIDNNKLLVGDASAPFSSDVHESDFRLTKLNLDGTLDTTFNSTGIFTYNFTYTSLYPYLTSESYDSANCFYLHENGEILIAGRTDQRYTYYGLGMIRLIDSALNTDNFKNTKNFTVYPNPAKNTLFIKNNFDTKIDRLVITDIMGRVVHTNGSFESIDMSDLQSGMYNLQIMSGKSQSVFKFVKE